jgi:hypothetical protein
MTVENPEVIIRRRSVEQPAGEVGHWVKMFDPPQASPPTPELLEPTNPVPEVMLAAGLLDGVPAPHTLETSLLHGLSLETWDNRDRPLFFMTFRQANNPAAPGNYPAPTIRVPRGAVFHAHTQGLGPPPHTIHWHGIEPTPINDGVGHCSMEIGDYLYQWQPNFIGLYFYHCHRNTVQHFEFGLFGTVIIDPPDAFFASLNPDGTLNDIAIGAGRDGLRRTAANLRGTPLEGLQDNFNPLGAPDPEGEFETDPHAHTVPYDVEALWVVDDRDSVWSDFAQNARAFFPAHGTRPGVNDTFFRGFFHDYNADYWFISGAPVVPLDREKRLGNTGAIDPDLVIPAGLNSGVSGTQVSINAEVGQTIRILALCAAYNCARFTFPADVVINSFDGRALGVPPFGQYNRAFLLPAGTPILLSTARRFECLMRPTRRMDSFATVEFLDTQRGEGPGPLLQTARIPIVVA